jgi:hypothetical protein
MFALHEAHSKLPPRSGLVLAAALVTAAMWPAGAAAQAEGSCTVNRATFRSDPGFSSTNSATFVNIPDTALEIAVGGADPTCVIVVFSAQTQTTENENMAIRARIPGIGNGEPEEVNFGPGTGAVEARAAQFVFEEVPPGNYTLRMQYRSSVGATTVTIGKPTVVVHHR